jgi:hypothetical protein
MNTAKGGKPHGAPARRLFPARLIGAGPFPAPAAPRRPSGCRMPLRRFAPLRHGPQGPGAFVGPAPAAAVQVLARCRPSMVFATLTKQREPPLRHRPPRGGARSLCSGAPALARKSACKARPGEFPPGPLPVARVGAGGRQESLIITATVVTNVMPPSRMRAFRNPDPGACSGARKVARAGRCAPRRRGARWGRALRAVEGPYQSRKYQPTKSPI